MDADARVVPEPSVSATDRTLAAPVSATDRTLAAPVSATDQPIAAPVSATDRTLAAPVSATDRTLAAPVSATDQTIASAGALRAVARTGARVGRATTLDGRGLRTIEVDTYAIERILTRGGMGRISVAIDSRLRRTVALKETLVDDARLRRYFLREATITAQLQHPSIVPVYEAGFWPDGEPFYAMKLVEGRPLRERIERAGTLAARLELLPNVTAVADALSYAHAHQVIHRDLKPDNVLIGAFGETVVIDWGLAKRLGDDDDDGADGVPPGGDLAGTQVGDRLGTPAFMAPEQGRGDPADASSDVYALGAMLYSLLTARPPYADARDVPELLGQLAARPPTPVRELAPDAPPELVTIVEKAMAREPSARYPTAAELAADLRAYTTGQLVGAHAYTLGELLGRWLRRHRVPLAIAGVAAAVLVVVAAFGLQRIRRARDVAEAERAAANRHRGDVEDLLEFMLTDLRAALTRTGNLDAIDAAGRRALAYFDAHDPGDDPAALARGARALNEVAQVLAERGLVEESLAAFDKAAAAARRGLARRADHPAAFEAWWTARRGAVGLHVIRDQLDLAAGALAELGDEAIPAALDDDARDLLRAGRADVADELARARGDLDASRRARLEALAARRRRLDRRPTDSARAVDVANANGKLARIGLVTPDLPAARAAAEEGLGVLEATLAIAPGDQAARRAQATLRYLLGAVSEAGGAQAEALAHHRAALRIAEDLLQLDATSVPYRRDLGATENNIARVLAQLGQLEEARAHQTRGTALALQLHERDPRNDTWAQDLALAYDNEARLASAHGRVDDALAFARKSEALRRERLAHHPGELVAHHDLAISLSGLGQMLLASGRAAEAVEVRRRATVDLAEVVRLRPDATSFQVDACEAALDLGDALRAAGDRAGGLAEMGRAWDQIQALVRRPEASDKWRAVLGRVAILYADALHEAGRTAEARTVAAGGVAALEKVVAAQPDSVIFALNLGEALIAQALALDSPESAAAAAAALARARAVQASLATRYPNNAQVRLLGEGLATTVLAHHPR